MRCAVARRRLATRLLGRLVLVAYIRLVSLLSVCALRVARRLPRLVSSRFHCGAAWLYVQLVMDVGL